MTNLTELFSYTHDVLPVPEGVPNLTAFDPDHYSKAISELYAKSAQSNSESGETFKPCDITESELQGTAAVGNSTLVSDLTPSSWEGHPWITNMPDANAGPIKLPVSILA